MSRLHTQHLAFLRLLLAFPKASELHLFVAEAKERMSQVDLSWATVNVGSESIEPRKKKWGSLTFPLKNPGSLIPGSKNVMVYDNPLIAG